MQIMALKALVRFAFSDFNSGRRQNVKYSCLWVIEVFIAFCKEVDGLVCPLLEEHIPLVPPENVVGVCFSHCNICVILLLILDAGEEGHFQRWVAAWQRTRVPINYYAIEVFVGYLDLLSTPLYRVRNMARLLGKRLIDCLVDWIVSIVRIPWILFVGLSSGIERLRIQRVKRQRLQSDIEVAWLLGQFALREDYDIIIVLICY